MLGGVGFTDDKQIRQGSLLLFFCKSVALVMLGGEDEIDSGATIPPCTNSSPTPIRKLEERREDEARAV